MSNIDHVSIEADASAQGIESHLKNAVNNNETFQSLMNMESKSVIQVMLAIMMDINFHSKSIDEVLGHRESKIVAINELLQSVGRLSHLQTRLVIRYKKLLEELNEHH